MTILGWIGDFLLWLLGLVTGKSTQEKLGQQETQNTVNKGIAEAERKALDAQGKVAAMPDAAVDDKLRSEFTRH